MPGTSLPRGAGPRRFGPARGKAGQGSGGDSYGQPQATAQQPQAAPAQSAPTSGASSGSREGEAVKLALSPRFGQILTDARGRTLYAFTMDKGGTPHCGAQCAASWPPVWATGQPRVGLGLNQALVGLSTRGNGRQQLKYRNWPLYYYAGDVSPGQTEGQGLQGAWYLMGPNGLVRTQSQASSATGVGTGSGGGYGYGG